MIGVFVVEEEEGGGEVGGGVEPVQGPD